MGLRSVSNRSTSTRRPPSWRKRSKKKQSREPASDVPPHEAEALIGSSPAMQELFKSIALVAPTDVPVLITGESGNGKELVAWAIHRHSGRRDGPFPPICVAALNPGLVERELFAHVKGSFWPAASQSGRSTSLRPPQNPTRRRRQRQLGHAHFITRALRERLDRRFDNPLRTGGIGLSHTSAHARTSTIVLPHDIRCCFMMSGAACQLVVKSEWASSRCSNCSHGKFPDVPIDSVVTESGPITGVRFSLAAR